MFCVGDAMGHFLTCWHDCARGMQWVACAVQVGAGYRAKSVVVLSISSCVQTISTFNKAALKALVAARAGHGITPAQVSIKLRCDPIAGQAPPPTTGRRVQTALTDGALLQVSAPSHSLPHYRHQVFVVATCFTGVASCGVCRIQASKGCVCYSYES